jgi:tRNA pseudouridine38-40 synthase
LLGRDRTQAAATAVSDGLYLIEVRYPDHCGLPRVDSGPAFLPSESHT